jgi:hypothetical protein
MDRASARKESSSCCLAGMPEYVYSHALQSKNFHFREGVVHFGTKWTRIERKENIKCFYVLNEGRAIVSSTPNS